MYANTKRRCRLYRELLRDGRFFALLLSVDRGELARVRAKGCPRCGGPLHAGHFERKPRGTELCRGELPEGYATRFGLCCGWCRSRTLPGSVRFLGRKVYLAVVVCLATVLVRGADRDAVQLLRRELGVSWSTLRRWCAWWRALTGSAFWQRVRGWLAGDLDLAALPGSLLDRLEGASSERMLALLRLLARGNRTEFPEHVR